MRVVWAVLAVISCFGPARAETPEEWIALGTRVHGGFGAFIPLGIRIGEDAVKRLGATGRDLIVTYYDSDTSPCACFADGIAIATRTSAGQRNLRIAAEKAPADTLALIVISRKSDGKRARYTVPATSLPRLGLINRDQPDPRQRWDSVARDDTLFTVQNDP